MQLPESVGLLLFGSHQVWHLDVLFISHPVGVFVKVIKQLVEELSRVVLIVALIHLRVRAEDFLEMARIHVPIAAGLVPLLVPKLGQGCDDLTFASQHIISVNLVVKVHAEKVVADALDVSKALQGRVHVARVAQVVQANNAI